MSYGGSRTCLKLNNNNNIKLNFATLKINNPKNYVYTSIFRLEGIKNIIIKNGTVIGDRDTNPNNTGNQGHGIIIDNTSNVFIDKMTIINMFGDGIKINSTNYENLSSNIVVENSTIDKARRNGITVGFAHDIIINNCIITNIKGCMPESGIDIEPNYSEQPANNIRIINNVITDCNTQGIVNGNSSKNLFINKNYLKNNKLNLINCENVIVEDNIFIDSESISIRGVSNIKVSNNQLFNTPCSITGFDKKNNKNIKISDNLFCFSDDNDKSCLAIGGTTLDNTEDLTFENNIVENPNRAFSYFYTAIKKINILNNIFYSKKINNFIFLIRSDEVNFINNEITVDSFSDTLSSTFNFSSNEQLIKNNIFIIKQVPKYYLFSILFLDNARRADISNNILKSNHDLNLISGSVMKSFLSVTYNDFRNSSSLGVVPNYEVGNRLKVNAQAQVQQLNTIYHLEKMKQENVYGDYITYVDEKTAYDKKQKKLEQERQLAYQEALKENPELTYEEFMSLQPMTLNLVEEPQPSEALRRFMEKYL